MQLKSSAPGSLMLLGEYAVLHGQPALVCALDKRIYVTLTPRTDDVIRIQSVLGEYETTLSTIDVIQPFSFVLAAIKQYAALLKEGFDLTIESEFSDQVGLGSSAAVTVATLSVIVKWLNIKMLPMDIIRQGRNIIRRVQGVGSGADVAASVLGGMVAFHAQPLAAEKLPETHPLAVLYVGFKTATVNAIEQVQTRFSQHDLIFKSLCQAMGDCALQGIQSARKGLWDKLGTVMNIQQGLMVSLGVSLPIIDSAVQWLHQYPAILGAKISGSGLGDCVVGLGSLEALPALETGITSIPVGMSLQGVQCEKI